MNSTVLSLLAAFLLSLMGLFAFMWSMRKGLLVENPGAASAIFTPGEIGQADDPTLTAHDRERLQKAINATNAKTPDERWQAAHARLAGGRGVAHIRPHPHDPPECGAVWLDH